MAHALVVMFAVAVAVAFVGCEDNITNVTIERDSTPRGEPCDSMTCPPAKPDTVEVPGPMVTDTLYCILDDNNGHPTTECAGMLPPEWPPLGP